MAETFQEVKTIIMDLLGVEEVKVTPQAKFREDLEADSLDLVELIMAFEEKFGGEISDEDAQKITTVGEAVIARDPVGAKRIEGPVLEEDVDGLAERGGAGGQDRCGLELVVGAREEHEVQWLVH